MFDTHVTVVGNVLHLPEMRQTANTGAIVTTFRIASTARRLDRETGRWVDGNSLRVRVTCWRALALNVKQSVTIGDPLIVTGRLFTRDWEDENGVKRTAYELEAVGVGHDLSRGRAVFERVKQKSSISVVEDSSAEQRVGGEVTEVVSDDDAPARFDDTPFEAAYDQPAAGPFDAVDSEAAEGGAGESTSVEVAGIDAGSDGHTPIGDGDDAEAEPVDDPGAPAPRRRGGRRAKVPA